MLMCCATEAGSDRRCITGVCVAYCVFVIGVLPDPILIRLYQWERQRVCMDLSPALWLLACIHTHAHTVEGICSHSTRVPNWVCLLVGLLVQWSLIHVKLVTAVKGQPWLTVDPPEAWEKRGQNHNTQTYVHMSHTNKAFRRHYRTNVVRYASHIIRYTQQEHLVLAHLNLSQPHRTHICPKFRSAQCRSWSRKMNWCCHNDRFLFFGGTIS